MRERISLPRLYCIVDAGCFAGAPDPTSAITRFARELIAGGAMLIQYRNKTGGARQMLSQARELKRVAMAYADEGVRATQSAGPRPEGQRPLLIVNDRADLCLAAGLDGVHLGQHDLSVEGARQVFAAASQGRQNPLVIGLSTHTADQVVEADEGDADYFAIGPVFATASKKAPDPVVGLDGVRRARAATRRPLVAIGGITRQNCRSVIEAGADSVAVIGDLLSEPRQAVREFMAALQSK